MPRLSCSIFALVFLYFVCISPAVAQKNLFEVPSAEIVEKKQVFFQTQAVLSRDEVNVMAGATYGLGKGFELGLAFNQWDFQRAQGLTHDAEHPEQSPDILITAQKAFIISKPLAISVGLRSGINNVGSKDNNFADFTYSSGRYTFGENVLVVGGYYANYAFEGPGDHFGLMAGADITLVKDSLHFITDFLSGNSALGIINTGLEVELPYRWSVCAGAQLPWPGSDNAYGAVLQISWN